MTLEEYNVALRKLAERKEQEIILSAILPAAIRLRANIQNRVNRIGKGTAGNKLKPYSTKPGYYTKEQFVKKSAFKPIGKRGFKGERVVDTFKLNKYNSRLKSFSRTQAKSVVKHEVHSMFLKNGYKELRDIQGRPTNVTNLFYTGDLFKSFIVGKSKNSIQIGFDNMVQSRKRKGLEAKYNTKIFYGSQSEIETYSNEVIKQYSLTPIIQNG